MSRFLLLSILILWMCPRDAAIALPWPTVARLSLFFGAYAALVLLVSAWSRLLARRVADDDLGRTLERYNRATEWARYFVPAWFAVGLFGLGWGQVVHDLLHSLEPRGLRGGHGDSADLYWRVPGLLLGTLPPLLAWVALWWAQYPADRALKEQAILYQANEGLPIHPPAGFAALVAERFRTQILLALAPVVLIIAARDLLALGYVLFARHPLPRDGGDLALLPVALAVVVLAPEVIRRVIPTTPLPRDWRLRDRLEALCRRAGLKYRDILLWHTNSSMGNAMVMGLFPRVRYVFLSDLLLETMRDEEIEAVFAHEIGHIVHRHLWWYVLFAMTVVLFASGPLAWALDHVPALAIPDLPAVPTAAEVLRHNAATTLQGQVLAVLIILTFGLCFGLLSRRFERQADVYAARTMEATRRLTPGEPEVTVTHANPDLPSDSLPPPPPPRAGSVAPALAYLGPSYVGEYGATVVGGALYRVARINNIPLAAHEWLHGSIQQRMRYLLDLSAEPARTKTFDRTMRRLYWGLLAGTAALFAWCYAQYGPAGLASMV